MTFRVRWRGAEWDADLICDPLGAPQVWQLYGYPCDPNSGGALQNHWVPVAEAAEIKSAGFTVSSPSVNEPAPGQQTTLVFAVDLKTPSDSTLTLNYATRNNTAIAGFDYLATSGTLIFAPGEVSKNVTVTVLGDSVSPEPVELVSLQVSDPFTFDPPVIGRGAIADWVIPRRIGSSW